MKRSSLIRALSLALVIIMSASVLFSCSDANTSDEVLTTESTTEPSQTEAPVPGADATVNSVPLKNFVIVYALDDDRGRLDSAIDTDLDKRNDDKTSVVYAENIRKAILESTGYDLEVKPDSEDESEYEIIIGNVKRDVVTKYYDNQYENVARYRIDIQGKKIALLSVSEPAKRLAAEEFIKKFFSSKQDTLSIVDADSFDGDASSDPEYAINARINETDIRIASNNILFHEWTTEALYVRRTPALVQSFVLFDADVLMLQECGYLKSKTANNRTWHDVLDPILPTIGYTQVPITLDKLAKENYTPIWYRADKLELIDSDYHLYESVKQSPDSYLSDSKSYTLAVFKVKGTEDMFACFSTHLTYAGDATLANKLRKDDANEIIAGVLALREKYGDDIPIILMGDLNCSTASEPYSILSRKLKNVINYAGVKKNNTDYGTLHDLGVMPKKGAGIIDHTMLGGKGFKPVQYQYVVNHWSVNSTDHIPLIVDITFDQ